MSCKAFGAILLIIILYFDTVLVAVSKIRKVVKVRFPGGPKFWLRESTVRRVGVPDFLDAPFPYFMCGFSSGYHISSK